MTDATHDHEQTVTAFFDTRASAEKAKADVVAAGIPIGMVTIVEGHDRTAGTTTTQANHGGFWESVKEMFAPDEDKHAYAEGLSRGGFLLTAQTSTAHYDRVLDILDHEGAVDMDERETQWKKDGWSGYHGATPMVGTGTAASLGTEAPVAASAALADRGTTMSDVASGLGGETIKLAEETLRVGKRDVNHGRVRLRSYVVEKPVNESVSLHSETVDVTRRPVGPTVAAGEDLFKERTISAEETSQEAVVSKQAHVYEEVSLGKNVQDRTKEIKDTVRRTEVEVDDARTAAAAGTSMASGSVASKITEHMPVIGSDGVHVGTVDHLEGVDHIKLTRTDSTDGMHHLMPQSWVHHVDEHVHLNKTSTEAMAGMKAV